MPTEAKFRALLNAGFGPAAADAILAGLAEVAATVTDSGGGVLANPENEWEAETVVEDEYQIRSGQRVFSALVGGTTGTERPEFDGPIGVDEVTPDGDFTWKFLGFIGGVPFTALQDAIPLMAIPQSGPLTENLDADGHDITNVGVLSAGTVVLTLSDDPGISGALYVDGSDILALEIADPSSATAEDIATAFNALLVAIEGVARISSAPG